MTPHQQLALRSRIVYHSAQFLHTCAKDSPEFRIRLEYHLEATELRWPGSKLAILAREHEKSRKDEDWMTRSGSHQDEMLRDKRRTRVQRFRNAPDSSRAF